jgi:DNA modification methylase
MAFSRSNTNPIRLVFLSGLPILLKIKNMSKKLEWHTEKRKVKDLIQYDKNPRTLSPIQLDGLKRSLKKFNLAESPAVNIDGKICAGNQRILALSLLGRSEEEIDVRVPNRTLTEKEFKDYLLTSNRSGGSWDWEKLASEFNLDELLVAGFDSSDLENIFNDNLSVEDDDLDEEAEIEKAKDTDIKPGDYFSIGRHRLFCGSSLDVNNVKKLMAGTKADLINDDLPFNIGLSYDKGVGNNSHYGGTINDSKSDEEYRNFAKAIMQNALSVTKSDAHVIFWCDERNVWLLQTLYRELGIDSKRLCIWIKDNASPTPKLAFNKVTEFAVYGTVGKPYLNDKIKNLNEIANKEVTTGNRLTEDILDLLNIWMVKRLSGNTYQHPTMKPPTLYEKSLRRCTRPGDIVLDLTAGSGSLLLACEQLKRTAYLCELEPIFCQVIINRFKNISNEPIKKLN